MPRSASKPHACRPGRRLLQRNRQVEANRDLVGPIAAHYAAHSAETREDLEQVGLLGLIRAAELYDRALAVPFSAYARRHVRGAILHYLRDTAPLVRQPRRLQEQRQQRDRLERVLELQLGRRPGPLDLCRALGLSLEQWHGLQQQPWQQRLWLEQQELAACNADAATGVDRGAVLLIELKALDPRQRRVVQAVVLEGCSLRDVAARMGSSAATVHRLLHRGLNTLRTRLTAPSGVPTC
jgi:RNA polymerase sigma-B factor